MNQVPDDLRYTESHEWVRDNQDGTYTLGITYHAQEQLGDLVFVELPSEGASFQAQEGIMVTESVKAATDVYAPVDGEVLAVNEKLIDNPELVNEDPYGEGWFFHFKCDDEVLLDSLMGADRYMSLIEND